VLMPIVGFEAGCAAKGWSVSHEPMSPDGSGLPGDRGKTQN
jgi:hypothetical protein